MSAKRKVVMIGFKPIILTGSKIQLEPLNDSHKQELYTAAQHEAIWNITSAKAFGDKFYSWFDNACLAFQQQEQLPFVVRHIINKKIIGSTRYYHVDPEHRRLMIGYTWYIPEYWGTYVNPESKLLLMTFAFEELQVNRVSFEIDSRNARSHAALTKLGAHEEGVLRQHMVLDNGYIRDTIVFSILKCEWPQVKVGLQERLHG